MSFSKKEALRYGWNTFKAQPWVYVGAGLIIAVLSLIFNSLAGKDHDAMSGIITLVGTVLQWWLYLGFMRMALAAHAGTPIRINMVFGESWKTVLQYAIVAILSGILVALGFILLIVPGFIVAMMLSLAPLILLDRHTDGIESMKESRRMTEGHRANLFLLFLLMVGLNIIGALAVGVGLLVTAPVSVLAFVYAYKQIERSVALEPVAAPAPTSAPTQL